MILLQPALARRSATDPGSPAAHVSPMRKRVDAARALAPFPDRPHHQRLSAPHVAAGEHARGPWSGSRVDLRRCPRSVSSHAELREHACRGSGPRKPRASSTRSQSSSNSLPGTSFITGRPLSCAHSRRTPCSFFTLPCSSPLKRLVLMLQSRVTPSSCDDRGAQDHRPVGPGELRAGPSGGCGSSSNWCTDDRAVAVRRAEAVRSGVAAAEDDDVLAAWRGSVPRRCRPATTLFCCGRNSMAKWMPVQLAAGDRQVARLASRRRRARWRRSRARSCVGGRRRRRRARRCGRSRPRPPSAPCAGRSSDFSILKSGMP